jgi:hypothetical protein
MASISNDHDLREALNGLSAIQQRVLGAKLTESVIHLCKDDRIRRALAVANNPDASDEELEDALKAAKSYASKTYTDCGTDTNWLSQADHFVAAAAAAALTPVERLAGKTNPAWKAAMQARMAKNCEMMESEEVAPDSESERQYRIVNDLL